MPNLSKVPFVEDNSVVRLKEVTDAAKIPLYKLGKIKAYFTLAVSKSKILCYLDQPFDFSRKSLFVYYLFSTKAGFVQGPTVCGKQAMTTKNGQESKRYF